MCLLVERISIPSVDFAQKLYTVLAPHLPEFPYPAWVKKPAGATARAAHSCNSNIRLYKYATGQYFGPHYDDSVRDAETGAKSEWTLLVYLTGAQDGVEGGEVGASDAVYALSAAHVRRQSSIGTKGENLKRP